MRKHVFMKAMHLSWKLSDETLKGSFDRGAAQQIEQMWLEPSMNLFLSGDFFWVTNAMMGYFSLVSSLEMASMSWYHKHVFFVWNCMYVYVYVRIYRNTLYIYPKGLDEIYSCRVGSCLSLGKIHQNCVDDLCSETILGRNLSCGLLS